MVHRFAAGHFLQFIKRRALSRVRTESLSQNGVSEEFAAVILALKWAKVESQTTLFTKENKTNKKTPNPLMKLSIKINTSGHTPVLLLPLQRRKGMLLGQCWKLKQLNAYYYAFIQSRTWSLYHAICLWGGMWFLTLVNCCRHMKQNGQTPSFVPTNGQMLWSVSWCIHITQWKPREGKREKKAKAVAKIGIQPQLLNMLDHPEKHSY